MKFLIFLTLITSLLMAAPAFNGKHTFTQPDGEQVTYQLQGDEYLHWLERDDGSLMLYSKKNRQMESIIIDNETIKPSGKAIHKPDQATVNNNLTRSSRATRDAVITRETLLKLQDQRRAERHSKTTSTKQLKR